MQQNKGSYIETILRNLIVAYTTRIVLAYCVKTLPDLVFSMHLADLFCRIQYAPPEQHNLQKVDHKTAVSVYTLYEHITDAFLDIYCAGCNSNVWESVTDITIDNEIIDALLGCLYTYLTDYAVLHNAYMFYDTKFIGQYKQSIRPIISSTIQQLSVLKCRPVLDVQFEEEGQEMTIVIEWDYV